MNDIADSVLTKLLYDIQKPGQYIGGEWNAVKKDPGSVKTKVALAFPDLYEIGMSHLGQRILYHLLNKNADIAAERVFAPWMDFEQRLRECNVPLFSLENRIPLFQFDIIGFSLLYELNYTNILTILDLGKIPLLAKERDQFYPLVIAGGPAVFNPEPVADIFDLFAVGDGEELFPEIISLFQKMSGREAGKMDLLKALSTLDGIYVPAFAEVHQPPGSKFFVLRAGAGGRAVIQKRIQYSLEKEPFPEEIVVPNVGIVFDRIALEAERGCPQKCRFCQASAIYFPPRPRDPSHLIETGKNSVRKTGYEDVSLTALSISDYPYLSRTVQDLMESFESKNIALSLSALRPKGLTPDIAEDILKVRKTGFTIVPEAGTDRLRRVINKNLTQQEIRDAVRNAFSHGWRLLKLYFMVGLPTETEEDLQGIVDTVKEIIRIGYEELHGPPQIHLSIASFIPKPHTPFQWEKMDDAETLKKKFRFLLSKIKRYRFVQFKRHPVMTSLLEGIFSRGDRRLSNVLVQAWERGARFDSWNDRLDFSIWENAFEAFDLDYTVYFDRIDYKAPLPWDHIDTGVKKEYLLKEREKAYREESSPSCLDMKCSQCLGCSLWTKFRKIDPVPFKAKPVRKLSSENPQGVVFRFRAVFSKKGMARFFSHKDVMRIIQRGLRRAGIAVVYSAGFHPKMQISHLPALPLGMEGKEEIFEFKMPQQVEKTNFLERINHSLPGGIEILDIIPVSQDHPALIQDIDRVVYSLDLNIPLVQDALEKLQKTKKNESSIEARLKNQFPDVLKTNNMLDSLFLDEKKKELKITFIFNSKKAPKPQDIVSALLPVQSPVYAMAREKIIMKSGHIVS